MTITAPETKFPVVAGKDLLLVAAILALPLSYLHGIVDGSALPRWVILQTLFVALLLNGGLRPFPKGWVLLGFAFLVVPALTVAGDVGFRLLGLSKLMVALQCLLIGLSLGQRLKLFQVTVFVSATMVAVIGMLQIHDGFAYFPQVAAPAASFVNRNVAAQFMVGAILMGIPILRYGFWTILPLSLQFGYLLSCQSRGAVLAVFMACTALFAVRHTQAMASLRFDKLAVLKVVASLLLALCLQEAPLRAGAMMGSRVLSYSPIWISALVIGFGFPFMWVRLRAYKLPLAVVLTMLCLGLAWSLPQTRVVQRWLESVNPEADLNTAQVRISLYANSLAMIADHPLRGHGPGQFEIQYPRYNDALLPTPSLNHRTLPRTLHQDFLQFAVEYGLPLFLALMIGLGFVMTRIIQIVDLEPPLLAILLGVLAITCHAQVSFPLHQPASVFLFWSGLGILLGRLPMDAWADHRAGMISKIVLMILSLGFLALSLLQGFASHLHYESHQHLAQNKPREAYVYAMHADRLFPFDGKALDHAVTVLTTHAPGKDTTRALLDTFVERYPYHPNGYYRMAYDYGQSGDYEKAFEAIARVKELAATDAEVYLLEGILHRRMGNREKAREAFNHCLRLHANHSGALWELRTL